MKNSWDSRSVKGKHRITFIWVFSQYWRNSLQNKPVSWNVTTHHYSFSKKRIFKSSQSPYSQHYCTINQSCGKEAKIFWSWLRMIVLWIMYLMGGLERYIGRYIGQYIGRYSAEYRSILNPVQVDISFQYRPIVHLMILMVSVNISTAILSVVYRSTIGYISVDC